MQHHPSAVRALFSTTILLAFMLLGACSTVRYVAADKAFYARYSKQLGVQFEGNENPDVIREAAQWLGVPYRYGGASRSGTDCSGFVSSVFRNACRISLPRTVDGIKKQTARIRRSKLRCGDLVFFSIRKSWRSKTEHIGIYLSNGKFIHASSSRGVMVSDLGDSYWRASFVRAGRVRP